MNFFFALFLFFTKYFYSFCDMIMVPVKNDVYSVKISKSNTAQC